MDKKISIGVKLLCKRHGYEFALETAKKIGADGVDFGNYNEDYRKPESIYSKSEEEIAAYFTAVYEKATSLGLKIAQSHGRLVICHDDPAETEAAIKNARLDCLAAHYLHTPYVVFHGVTKYFNGLEPTAENIHHLNETLFARILDFAKEFDVKIATESFGDSEKKQYFFANLAEFQKTFDKISSKPENKDRFVVCLDTGHTHTAAGIYGNPSVGDTIRQLGNRIQCLHLQDNNGLSDQHRLPFSGSVDWIDVLDALDEIGYTGWYNLELKLNQLKTFGRGFEIEYAAFAVKTLRFMLTCRYGAENCCIKETDNSWLSYRELCGKIM